MRSNGETHSPRSPPGHSPPSSSPCSTRRSSSACCSPLVEIRQGKILWETFSFSPYVTLWSNPSVLSALSNTAIVALTAVADRLRAGGGAGALHRMGRRDRQARSRTRHLLAVPAAADRHRPGACWCLGANWASTAALPQSLWATRSSSSPSPTASCSRACRRCPARSSRPRSISAPAAGKPCATCCCRIWRRPW